MAEKSRGVTKRTNAAGMGYFDVFYRGVRSKIYTGKADTPENASWFAARQTLLAEMVLNGTFEIEKAKAVIGVSSQRQKRTVPKVKTTIAEFGEEWLEHKKTVIRESKVDEYRECLALVCTLKVGSSKQKRQRVRFGSIPLRDLRNEHVDWLTNTLSQRAGLKGPKISNTRLNDILLNVRNRIWNPTLERAGLRHRTPYQTRHTFASLMLDQNEDPAWVSRMLSHTALRMLYERYGKFIHNWSRQDRAQFASAWKQALEPQPSLERP